MKRQSINACIKLIEVCLVKCNSSFLCCRSFDRSALGSACAIVNIEMRRWNVSPQVLNPFNVFFIRRGSSKLRIFVDFHKIVSGIQMEVALNARAWHVVYERSINSRLVVKPVALLRGTKINLSSGFNWRKWNEIFHSRVFGSACTMKPSNKC